MTNNPTERLIKTLSYLEQLFDFCNDRFFGSELIKPVITVQRDERNKTYGWFSTKLVDGYEDKDGAREINLTAQQLNRDINDHGKKARR